MSRFLRCTFCGLPRHESTEAWRRCARAAIAFGHRWHYEGYSDWTLQDDKDDKYVYRWSYGDPKPRIAESPKCEILQSDHHATSQSDTGKDEENERAQPSRERPNP